MDEQQTSIWKKEISFRRKPKEPKEAKPKAEKPARDAETSVWKKEIHLFGKSKPAEAELEAALPEPEPAAPAAAPDPDPDPEPEPVAEGEPELEPVVELPAPRVEHDWLTAPLEEVSLPPLEDDAVEPAAAAAVEPEPILVEPLADLTPAVVEPAPEPAAEPAERVPFYKREVSLRGSKEPKQRKEPKQPKEPKQKKRLEQPQDAADERVPFYKRELSLKRTPKAERPPKPEPAPAVEAGDERVPFYKRELSFKRGPKAERAPKPERKPKERSGERVPFYKRELSMKRTAKEERGPKPERKPRVKAERRRGAPKGTPKKLVGLKIGGSQLAASVVDNGSLELLQAVRQPLERGIVVGGELRDPDALALALREFFSRHKLPTRGIRLGIANNRIGVRTFELSGIGDPKQLENAILFRAQEVLPIPIEDAVLDYQVLDETVDEDGNPSRRILLVVAYRELVDRYVQACRKAGLQVVGIDLEAFALLRALAPPRAAEAPAAERGALVAVSVGHDRSTFAVSDGRVCEFTRVLEWGGWALNVAIGNALEVTPSEVEDIKLALSLAGADGELPAGVTAAHMDTAREAARKQLQSFARELVSSLQFYQGQPGSLGIAEVVLTGGTAHLPGLGSELERLIGVPVRVADPLARVKVSKRVKEREQVGSLAVAIGLGIED